MTAPRRPARRRECPRCGRLTAYRLEWTPMVGRPEPQRIFRPHNGVDGTRCDANGRTA